MKKTILALLLVSSSLNAITYSDGRMVTGMLRMSTNNYYSITNIPVSIVHTNDFVLVKNSVTNHPAGIYRRMPNSAGWRFHHEFMATNWIHVVAGGKLATNSVVLSNFSAMSRRISSVSNTLSLKTSGLTNGIGQRIISVTGQTLGYNLRFKNQSNRITRVSNLAYSMWSITNGIGTKFSIVSFQTLGYGIRFVISSNRITWASNGAVIFAERNTSRVSNIISFRVTSVSDSLFDYTYMRVRDSSNGAVRFAGFRTSDASNVLRLRMMNISNQAVFFSGERTRAVSNIVSHHLLVSSNALQVQIWGIQVTLTNHISFTAMSNRISSVSNTIWWSSYLYTEAIYNILNNKISSNSNRAFRTYETKVASASKSNYLETKINTQSNRFWKIADTNSILLTKGTANYLRPFRNSGTYSSPKISFRTDNTRVVSVVTQVLPVIVTNKTYTTNVSAVSNPVVWHKMRADTNCEIPPSLIPTYFVSPTFTNDGYFPDPVSLNMMDPAQEFKMSEGYNNVVGAVGLYCRPPVADSYSYFFKTFYDRPTATQFDCYFFPDPRYGLIIASYDGIGGVDNTYKFNTFHWTSGELFHLAVAWNNNGSAGQRLKAWKNGTEMPASAMIEVLGTSTSNHYLPCQIGLYGFPPIGILEDVKIYNYFKTNWAWDVANEGLESRSSVVTNKSYVTNGSITNVVLAGGLIGNITIGTGTYGFHALPDFSGATIPIHFSTIKTQEIFTNINYFVVADYNNGHPFCEITTVDLGHNSSIIKIATVFWEKGVNVEEVHILTFENFARDPAIQLYNKDVQLNGFVRGSGLMLGTTSNRGITVTAGNVWRGTVYYDMTPVDTTSGNNPVHAYFLTNGNWYSIQNNRFNSLYYQGADGNRHQINDGAYAVNWVYRDIDVEGDACLFRLYGSLSNASLVDAQNETPPDNIPSVIENCGLLLGRIIVQKSSNTATLVDSVFKTVFGTSVAPPNHNNLLGLQGGAPNQYYHLTLSEVNSIVNIGFIITNQLASKIELSSTSNSLFGYSQRESFLSSNYSRELTGVFSYEASNYSRSIVLGTAYSNYARGLNNKTATNIGIFSKSGSNYSRGLVELSRTNDFIQDRVFSTNSVILPIIGAFSKAGSNYSKSIVNGLAYSNYTRLQVAKLSNTNNLAGWGMATIGFAQTLVGSSTNTNTLTIRGMVTKGYDTTQDIALTNDLHLAIYPSFGCVFMTNKSVIIPLECFSNKLRIQSWSTLTNSIANGTYRTPNSNNYVAYDSTNKCLRTRSLGAGWYSVGYAVSVSNVTGGIEMWLCLGLSNTKAGSNNLIPVRGSLIKYKPTTAGQITSLNGVSMVYIPSTGYALKLKIASSGTVPRTFSIRPMQQQIWMKREQ